MAKKKKPGRHHSAADTTVEIRLPTDLYKRVKKIKDLDKLFIDQTVRAVFGDDENYGITHVVLTESTLKEGDITRIKAEDKDKDCKSGYWKLCEG